MLYNKDIFNMFILILLPLVIFITKLFNLTITILNYYEFLSELIYTIFVCVFL